MKVEQDSTNPSQKHDLACCDNCKKQELQAKFHKSKIPLAYTVFVDIMKHIN